MAIGGACALFAWVVRETLTESINKKVSCDTVFYKFCLAIHNFSGDCLRFYKKSAQWVGSLIITLLIVGGVGRFAIFTVTHWREIWGP